MTLGALSTVLLGGILGLAWWSWRHRPGCEPTARYPRVRAGIVAAGLVIIAVGTVWRVTAALGSEPNCSPPTGALAASRNPLSASLVAEKAATWPETGIGMLYAQATDAHVCWSLSEDYYVALHDEYLGGARAMTLGDIVLSPRFNYSQQKLRALTRHEARHRVQWAIATVIGGPLAFPVAYTVDDFFFPGDRNHFERLAGLEAGGYTHSSSGPVLGPAQLGVLSVLAVVIAATPFVIRHRRASARSRGMPPSKVDNLRSDSARRR